MKQFYALTQNYIYLNAVLVFKILRVKRRDAEDPEIQGLKMESINRKKHETA